MKISERLKFEKEIYFVKYIFKRPFFVLGGSVIDFLKKPSLWLFGEFFLLMFLLWRNLFFHVFKNFPIVFDKLIISIILLMMFTFVFKIYLSQGFQEEYRKEKEEKIKKLLS